MIYLIYCASKFLQKRSRWRIKAQDSGRRSDEALFQIDLRSMENRNLSGSCVDLMASNNCDYLEISRGARSLFSPNLQVISLHSLRDHIGRVLVGGKVIHSPALLMSRLISFDRFLTRTPYGSSLIHPRAIIHVYRVTEEQTGQTKTVVTNKPELRH